MSSLDSTRKRHERSPYWYKAAAITPTTHRLTAARAAHSKRLAAFLGRELRRAETRFCPRRNGDSSSTSKSTRRASSSSSRAASALDGYNSSCKMVGLFRAINSDQLSSGNRELFHYSWI